MCVGWVRAYLLGDRRGVVGGELWSERCWGSWLDSAFLLTVLGSTFHLPLPPSQDFGKGRKHYGSGGGRAESVGVEVKALGNRIRRGSLIFLPPQNCNGQRAFKRRV